MISLRKSDLLTLLMALLVCFAMNSPICAQGKGGGKGDGGGGDPPPPGIPEVRYHVEHLQPPQGMEAMWVLNMARESRELIAEATEIDDPSIPSSRLFSIPHLRLDDGTWVRCFPPAEAGPVADFTWRVRAISGSGRFVLFFHQLDPDALEFECDFWVWDRWLDEYHHALYWPGNHRPVGYAINDQSDFLFGGFVGSILSTLFVSNAYRDGEPVEIGSGEFVLVQIDSNF